MTTYFQTRDGRTLTENDVDKLEITRRKWQERDGQLRTHHGLIPKPKLWDMLPEGRLMVKKRYQLTDVEEQDNYAETHSLHVDYTQERDNMTEKEVDEAITFYLPQKKLRLLKLQEEERQREKLKKELDFAKNRANPIDLHPIQEGIQKLRQMPESSAKTSVLDKGGRVVDFSGGPFLSKKRKFDYFLTLDTSDDEIRRDSDTYGRISHQAEQLWRITPVWRIYTFSFKKSLLSSNCQKLMTEFERESHTRWMDSIPVADVTRLEPRIYTRRVKRFSIHTTWQLFLDQCADLESHEAAGGSGLQQFLESTSRRQHDKWTPNYQSLTVMAQNIRGDLDPDDADPVIYRIYCLVARENIGRDVDSKSYLLVRPRYFDKNIQVDNESLTVDKLKIWMIRMGQEKKGRIFCGSTDFRITRAIQETSEVFDGHA